MPPRPQEWDRAIGLGIQRFCNGMGAYYKKIFAGSDALTGFSEFRDPTSVENNDWCFAVLEQWGGTNWPMKFKDSPTLLREAVVQFYEDYKLEKSFPTLWVLPLPVNQREFAGVLQFFSDKKYEITCLILEDTPRGAGDPAIWAPCKSSRAGFGMLNAWAASRHVVPTDATLKLWQAGRTP